MFSDIIKETRSRQEMKFEDDPKTWTDNAGYLAYALADVARTISGAIVAVVGAIAPIVILFAPANEMAKAIAGGATGLSGIGGGVALARSHPKKQEEVAPNPEEF